MLTIRALLVGLAWWVLVEGDASALAFGAPMAALALVARSALAPTAPPRVRPWGLARFAAVFLVGLVRGGVDVAWRALAPRLPVSPGWMVYDIRLSGDAPRRLFMTVISVMPGTLSVDVEGTELRLHALVTTGDDLRRQVETLEEGVAHVFGQAVRRGG